ncbi:MAG: rhomboid family intramembrane serine protease [Atopobiaceae bacterium]|nr:rhomboid family intramembrane serine protease [Atopobiaceae bacterium]
MAQDRSMRVRRITFNSPVVLGFVLLCVAERLLSMATGGTSTRAFFMTYHSSLGDPLTYVRFVTHVIGHGSWDHLVSNMAYILLLGPLLEEKYGSRTLLEIMVLTGLACGIVNYVLFPRQALCGASGICFAFILLSSVTSLSEGEIPLTFLLVAALFLGQQIVDAVVVRDNVSNLSHVIGGVVGAAAGFALSQDSWSARR